MLWNTVIVGAGVHPIVLISIIIVPIVLVPIITGVARAIVVATVVVIAVVIVIAAVIVVAEVVSPRRPLPAVLLLLLPIHPRTVPRPTITPIALLR